MHNYINDTIYTEFEYIHIFNMIKLEDQSDSDSDFELESFFTGLFLH